MTKTFYLRVDVTSDEDLEFYDEDGESSHLVSSTKRKQFNHEVEMAIKNCLIENIEVIQESFDEIEGLDIERQEALEKVASKYYDSEADLSAVTEMMTQDIKFTVVKRIKK